MPPAPTIRSRLEYNRLSTVCVAFALYDVKRCTWKSMCLCMQDVNVDLQNGDRLVFLFF